MMMKDALRVLLVEDSQSDAELTKRELRSAGISFVAECVETEKDFREKLQSFRPDIILSDYSLPTLNGMQALRLLQTLKPHLPFILVTGSLNEDTAVECMKAGADDYIIKEHISRLPFALKSALEKASMRQKKLEAEVAVRKSEQKFRELFDSAPVGYHELDIHGCMSNVNRTELEMLGYLREEMIGRPVWEFVPDSDASRERVRAKLAGSESPSRNVIRRYTRKDGTELPVLTEERLIYDEHGEICGIRTIIQDMSEQQRTEAELRKLSRVIHQSPTSIIITDSKGNIEYVNPAFEKVTEYTITEVLGKNTRILKSGKNPSQLYEQLWKTILAGGEWRGELLNRKKNGELFWEYARISTIRNEQGIIEHLVGLKEDITEHKKLENQLGQIQKMDSLGTLAGGIAHDFNNILGIIMAYTHVLSKLSGNENQKLLRSSVEGIRIATDRGTALVRQILTFARKSDSALEPVSINLTIKELAGMLTETFPKTIIFRLDLEKTVPIVIMDHNQLHQTLLNLCVNARDAMEGNGELTLRTRLLSRQNIITSHPDASAEYYVQITIADTGAGIPESIKHCIFEPFFTTKEKGKGTGLGLSVVYGAVLAQHGFIDVESQPGQGATFYLSFPVPEGIIQEHYDERTLEKLPGGTETVLLVEDEEVLMNVLKMVLEDAGYSVITARDGIEGLQKFERGQEKIDAVISDIGLPKLNGRAMLEAIVKLKPSVKGLLASGSQEPDLMKGILAQGAGEFVQKPYNPDDVLRKLRRVLDEGKKIQ
ncbi:MAG: PAS domain S-box protein [bacterium]